MTSLYVDRRDVELELDAGAIVFRENGERVGTVPVAPLTRVFLRGEVRFSASLLGKLGEAGVGVVVLSGRQGKPSLFLARSHGDAMRRVEQTRLSLDAGFSLGMARELVERKLAGQIAWFSEVRDSDMAARYHLTRAAGQLEEMRGRIPRQSDAAALRGLEGSAAACYFAGLRALVPESLGFTTRNRRPPRDPFNAVLSLTYVLVHSELAIALHGAGFDPYIGFYHAIDFGRASLALDLLEPLRAVADRFALGLFRDAVLRAEDFSQNESGCFLGKAGRSRYYVAYEAAHGVLRKAATAEVARLAGRIGHAPEGVPEGPREHAA